MVINQQTIAKIIAIAILTTGTTATASNLQQPPLPYKSDGCSYSPDFNFNQCCRDHDRAYYYGGSKQQRKRTDQKFRQCVRNKGHAILDDVYYSGVRVFAVPWLPTSFRWGFGYPFRKGHRGYTPQSKETEKILNE